MHRLGRPDTLARGQLEDYIVQLSLLHGGGDFRENGAADAGAADVMRSYQLQENPGYLQNRQTRATSSSRREL